MSQFTDRFMVATGIISGLLAMVLFAPSASAVSASKWQAGNIMSDDIFFNSSQMSRAGVQKFLNDRVPTCDTNGTKAYAGTTRAAYGRSKGYPPPYTCLKNYVENPTTHINNANGGSVTGGWTAARIIKHAADTYSINPKVLIVLLQKEQSLVTDDWPWTKQYRSATGYGCPDTAPCDAEYYGFYNQVMNAARQFRRYAQYPTEYRYKAHQSNYIQYNPVSSCGGSNVVIRNQATAGLYNYTPYQPNSSALNNLYGSGNSCGAYGNRNFWRMYNDWFGSTIVKNGPDIALSGDWNGNGRDTVGIKRGNTYYLDYDNDGDIDNYFSYGRTSDIPLVGDWNGDGTDTISLKIGNRYFMNNGLDSTTDSVFSYGSIGNKPYAGDWDRNGTDTISLKIGNRYFMNNGLDSTTDFVFAYGRSTDHTLIGDWNGNVSDTISLKIGNKYFINNKFDSTTDSVFAYGSSVDKPVPGDWNGNNSDTISLKIGNRYFMNNGLDGTTDSIFTYEVYY